MSEGPKRGLVDALLAKLEGELANMRRAASDARAAATHEEAKPENDKDTRALEASYLAGAQAARVRELEGAIKMISGMELLDLAGKTIQASALITLEDEDGERSRFFLTPQGGGAILSSGETTAQVVTPQSPLGRMLLGRGEGDAIEVRGKSGLREMTIVEVR
jgi:transcription elongation GreA/GreB family factor